MADWFTYVSRKYIRESLLNKGIRSKYAERYNYDETKKYINELPIKIASLRENKDIGKGKEPTSGKSVIDEVNEYKEVLDKLLEIRMQIDLL